jgi:hypothetical protein
MANRAIVNHSLAVDQSVGRGECMQGRHGGLFWRRGGQWCSGVTPLSEAPLSTVLGGLVLSGGGGVQVTGSSTHICDDVNVTSRGIQQSPHCISLRQVDCFVSNLLTRNQYNIIQYNTTQYNHNLSYNRHGLLSTTLTLSWTFLSASQTSSSLTIPI